MVFPKFPTYGEPFERHLALFARKDAQGWRDPFTPSIDPKPPRSSGSRRGTNQP